MRHIAISIAVLALAAVPLACGDDSPGSGARSDPAPTEKAPPREAAKPERPAKPSGQDGPAADEPARKPTAKRAESGDDFTSADGSGKLHGDGSIERFGEDGSDGDFDDAVETATAYYSAMASNDWDAACDRLADRVIEGLKGSSAGRSESGKAPSCSEILAGLVGPTGAAQLRAVFDPKTRFTGLRVDGEQGFLLLVAPAIGPGSLSVVREDDGWAVAALNASPL
jgi:hypothetical protein